MKLWPHYLLLTFIVPGVVWTFTTDDGHLVVFKSLNDGRVGGRLEIYFKRYNEFIPFCISSFDDRAAKLACTQLGYSYVQKYGTVTNLKFPLRESTYAIGKIICPVQAQQLRSCQFYEGSCSSYNGVAIICTNSRHSSVGIGLGVFFGLLIFIGGAASVAAGVLFIIWRKKRRLAQNDAHQLLRNIDESNEENGSDGSVVKKEGLQAENFEPTAPTPLYPPQYSEINTASNTGITQIQPNE